MRNLHHRLASLESLSRPQKVTIIWRSIIDPDRPDQAHNRIVNVNTGQTWRRHPDEEYDLFRARVREDLESRGTGIARLLCDTDSASVQQ